MIIITVMRFMMGEVNNCCGMPTCCDKLECRYDDLVTQVQVLAPTGQNT